MRIKNKRKNDYNDYIVLAGVILITALGNLSTLKNHLVADSWVFLFPHTFKETLGYFFKSIIPLEWDALWLRPIPMLFYWLDNIIWPGTEWGPHLTNVFFHVLNVLFIWLLIRFIYAQSNSSKPALNFRLPALTACILYGLHPLNVGSVGWVAARFDVMSVTFGLAGMLTWLKWDAGIKSTLNITLSSILLMSSILSKEQGIVFLMVCFTTGIFGVLTIENKRKKYWKGLMILALLVIIYIIYRFSLFHGIGGYLISKQGLSFAPPVVFFTAILFPYLNIFPNWTFSLTFLATSFFIITLMWGLIAAWRTDVQIQAWKNAGETAHQIISETVNTAPDPPKNSQILFFRIPRDNDQFAYIFGIGLKEAILRNYPGRNDIIISPKSQGKDLNRVKPEKDYVFAFNERSGKLERLLPQVKESKN